VLRVNPPKENDVNYSALIVGLLVVILVLLVLVLAGVTF